MKKILSVAIVVMLLFVGGYFLYQQPQKTKIQVGTEKEIIKIGAVLPLTGKYAGLGEMMKAGFLIGIDEINANNDKYHYQAFVEDAQSEAKTAISAYRKLKNINKVKIFLTGSSALSLALKPIVINDENLLLSVASHPAITADNMGYIIRACNRSIDESVEMAKFINANDSVIKKDSWIVYYNSEFGDSFKVQLEKDLGKNIVGITPYDEKVINLRSVLTDVVTKNPSNVLIIGFTPAMGNVIKTLKELGYNKNIVANLGMTSPSVLIAAGDSAKGVYFVNYDFPFESPHAKNLESIASTKYSTHFSSFSFLTYFGIKALDRAITETKSIDLKTIADHIKRTNSFQFNGVTFLNTINGDILPPLTIELK